MSRFRARVLRADAILKGMKMTLGFHWIVMIIGIVGVIAALNQTVLDARHRANSRKSNSVSSNAPKQMFNPDGSVASEFKQYVLEQRVRAEMEQTKYENIIKLLRDVEPSPAKDLEFTASHETHERRLASALSSRDDETAKRGA